MATKKTNILASLDIKIDIEDTNQMAQKAIKVLNSWNADDYQQYNLDDLLSFIVYDIDDTTREKIIQDNIISQNLWQHISDDDLKIIKSGDIDHLDLFYAKFLKHSRGESAASLIEYDKIKDVLSIVYNEIFSKDYNHPIFDWAISINDYDGNNDLIEIMYNKFIQYLFKQEENDENIWKIIKDKKILDKKDKNDDNLTNYLTYKILKHTLDNKKPITAWNIIDKYPENYNILFNNFVNYNTSDNINKYLKFTKQDKDKDEALFRAFLFHPKWLSSIKNVENIITDYTNNTIASLYNNKMPTELGFELIEKNFELFKILKNNSSTKIKRNLINLTRLDTHSDKKLNIDYFNKIYEFTDAGLEDEFMYLEKETSFFRLIKRENTKNKIHEIFNGEELEDYYFKKVIENQWDYAEFLIPYLDEKKVVDYAWKGIWNNLKEQSPTLGALLEKDMIHRTLKESSDIENKPSVQLKRKI